VVRVARERVGLAAELRDPPGVLHVVGLDVERDRHPLRHVEVREREDALLPVELGIRELPHVLLAVDLDVHRRASGGAFWSVAANAAFEPT
jgi:hypothetical protein